LRTATSSCLWRCWAPPILWTLIIVIISGKLGSFNHSLEIIKWVVSWVVTVNPDSLASINWYCRKVIHFFYYGILTVLWIRALTVTYPERLWTNRVLALILSLMVACFDEGHQYFSPGRTSSGWDILLDLSGGVVFLLLCARYFKKKLAAPVEAEPYSSCHLAPALPACKVQREDLSSKSKIGQKTNQ
jgi:VanZ family protein